jgi:hypothetical protein
MTKAEERAMEAYPDYRSMDGGYVTQRKKRESFIKGYHQAEKDLGLTVEDVELICEIEFSLCYSENRLPTKEAFYQEVLKRFKEKKEK